MITDHVASTAGARHRHKILLMALIAASILVAVGLLESHNKAFEYGTLWLFEQTVGGLKRHFLGGPE